ncbi:MAG: UDP-glucose/GDP-mannose dehydrogenase family protein [Bacteroidales bacterium]|jgi:UDPglucose 6-dehydrogenase|nr:UDP-glucose/GDP-mannose dehydrogenase family protein [Bacteroidales bacterium]MCU0409904.1 UDP-glucose/GDP-mannose dehydrogenase family protein [Bacteroidales bacterium]
MRIAVVGTGYVGLVTGTCFAETGVTVTCVDIDRDKISRLRMAKPPIYEPGLETMIRRNAEKGRLFFTTDIAEAIDKCEVVFITVGTPPEEDGSADLSHVLNVARDIGRHMQDYILVVTKSTVPVGAAEMVRKAVSEELAARNTKIPFDVASNPEFLKEGDAIEDFLRPERIVIGVDSERAEEKMRKLYKPFILNQHPILFMDIASAELTKYAANAMLATRISFINEIANLCDILGADVNLVRKGIGSDSRIGNKFLYPGVGYGGSCFPKDIKALIRTSEEKGYSMNVIKAVDLANEQQKLRLMMKITGHFGPDLKGLLFAVWGLTFKPQTDDTRESPSLVLINRLLEAGAQVKVYDPAGMPEVKAKLGDRVTYAGDPYQAAEGADALLLITEWAEFRLPDWDEVSDKLKQKIVFDGRNVFDPAELKRMGFIYYGIGRR